MNSKQILKSNYLTFRLLSGGDLKITATKEGRELIRRQKEDNSVIGIWLDLLEETSCNGSYCYVHPEKIGALTDSPIITNDLSYDDNGEVDFIGSTWWLPNYMVMDELKMLVQRKSVIFSNVN